jgi:hypothetical protein
MSAASTIESSMTRWLMRNEIEKDTEGSSHGLIQHIILRFAWRDWWRPQKTSVQTLGQYLNKGPPENKTGAHKPLSHIWFKVDGRVNTQKIQVSDKLWAHRSVDPYIQ